MKLDESHYVPILKGKLGELTALRRTEPKVAKRITPLVEVPPIPLAYLEGQEEPVLGKSIDKHVEDIGSKFVKALRGLPSVFIDAYYIEGEDELEDGSSPTDALLKSLRAGNIPFTPTIGLDRVEDCADSVRAAIQADARGCCLRLVEADLEGIADLGDQVSSLLTALEVVPNDVDLLLDFGPRVPSKAALPYQIDTLPFLEDWRTLTVASSCFPVDMSGIARNSVQEIDRDDWLVWAWLRTRRKSVSRMPAFGDYAINHPVLAEVDPRIISMSPNIRYTSGHGYVVAKGQAQPRKKMAATSGQKAARKRLSPSEQYPRLAATIKKHQSWKGRNFSWGDLFIDKCSRRECVGNPTDWRAVGTCHHIALVVQQIATLP
jgi:Beta protein